MAGEYRSLKKQHYLNLIKECASSGKNKQQWCSENGIKYSTFMCWQTLSGICNTDTWMYICQIVAAILEKYY